MILQSFIRQHCVCPCSSPSILTPPSPRLKPPFHFPLCITCILLAPPQPCLWSLVSVVTLCCIFTLEDLERGSADEREHWMFVFLSPRYLIHYNLF